MKALWLGRLARPDLVKPIGDLASFVQKWSRNCDKQLHRLVCYINSTVNSTLVGTVQDSTDELHLSLYVDADFAGERDAKSTSGGFLVLSGPHTHFPLAWVSKRQTSVSRSTTEAEIVSLAYSLYQEALPALSLWELILDRPFHPKIHEDNQATILVAKKGFSSKLRCVQRTHNVKTLLAPCQNWVAVLRSCWCCFTSSIDRHLAQDTIEVQDLMCDCLHV